MSDEPPFNAEAIAAALAHAAIAQGDTASVAALAVSVPRLQVMGDGDWINQSLGYIQVLSLYLEVPPDAFGRLVQVREDIQRRMGDIFRPIIDAHRVYQGSEVFIVPANEVPSDWRKQTLAWLRGEGITNQRALKAAGVSFAPLPVFVRGGSDYRRIEPDFIVVKGGMVAVIEVDGSHQESPVEAHDRTTMLVHEGAHVERVRASDCSTLEGAEVCAKRILASLAKVRASR